jgi:hypothetical protein
LALQVCECVLILVGPKLGASRSWAQFQSLLSSFGRIFGTISVFNKDEVNDLQVAFKTPLAVSFS